MPDFFGRRGGTSYIGFIHIQDINEAHERVRNSDVKYRFAIDMVSLKEEVAA